MKVGIAGMASLRLLRGLTIPELPLGYENPTMSVLINAFLHRGHEIVLFTTSVQIAVPTVYSAKDLTVCIAPRRQHAGRKLFKAERRDLLALMHDHPVEILNAHWSYEFAWAALDSNQPALVTLRDHAWTVFRYRPDPYRFMRLLMNNHVLRHSPYLSVNSAYLLNKLPRRYRIKAKVIPNAFGHELLSEQLPYRGRENYIVSVANGFGRRKNIETALSAFALLRRKWPSLRYRLIGDGMGTDGEASKFAQARNLAAGVEFIGNVSHNQVIEQVRNAKLLLHPALEESFGMSVLEAMVVGTPVIGGRESGNVPFLLDNGNSGILCDVLNPEAIASAADEILSDEQESVSLAERAADFARRNFSLDATTSAYIDYYQHILSREAGR